MEMGETLPCSNVLNTTKYCSYVKLKVINALCIVNDQLTIKFKFILTIQNRIKTCSGHGF